MSFAKTKLALLCAAAVLSCAVANDRPDFSAGQIHVTAYDSEDGTCSGTSATAKLDAGVCTSMVGPTGETVDTRVNCNSNKQDSPWDIAFFSSSDATCSGVPLGVVGEATDCFAMGTDPSLSSGIRVDCSSALGVGPSVVVSVAVLALASFFLA